MKKYNKQSDLNSSFSLLFFNQEACRPCKTMKSILESLEERHSDKLDFIYVETSKFPKITEKFNIKSLPSTILLKKSVVIDRFAGILSENEVESKIMNLLFNIEGEFRY